MAAPLGPSGGGSSDYGSDFSPEEEEALIQLLSQVPLQINAALPIHVDGFEDHKSLRGAVLPRRLTGERWDEVCYTAGSMLEPEQDGAPLEKRGDRSGAQIGM